MASKTAGLLDGLGTRSGVPEDDDPALGFLGATYFKLFEDLSDSLPPNNECKFLL